MSYESPWLRRLFVAEKAAEAARKYDERVVFYLNRGHDLMSARDLAHTDARFNWSPQEQADTQHDADLARDQKDWILAKQEHLGAEFEQVLFDNLWDLYAR